MSTSTEPSVRCPRCAAAARPGSDWCTLCYADLRARAAEPVGPAGVAPTAQAEAGAEPPPAAARGRGKHARATPPAEAAPAPTDVEQLADQLLAELAAGEAGNPFGRAAGLVDSTGKRVAVMIGGAVAAMTVLFLVLAALGALV